MLSINNKGILELGMWYSKLHLTPFQAKVREKLVATPLVGADEMIE